MYGNNFWRQVEITPEQIAYSTTHYVVVVTPKLWREQSRSDTDRQLGEFSVVNRIYQTIESTSNVLSTAIQYADTMGSILETLTKEEEKPSAQIVRMLPKDPAK